jgi:methylmalonyl-CoA epimerase
MEGADVAGAQLDECEVGGRVVGAVHKPYEQDGEGHEHQHDRGGKDPSRFSAAHGLTLQSHLMLFTEIDHVAIAVNDLEAAIDYYAETFGCEVEHREVVESDGVEEALLKVADSYVQLLTPTRDDSPVAKYLANKGEGLHHIGYRVKDCGEALQSVKDHGGRVIDEAPRPGSRGTTVAFVHPKTAFGTLIELVQE